MTQDLNKIEKLYETVAREYAAAFSSEHEKKPKDKEILRRFSQEIGVGKPVWDIGCGPGQTTKFLKSLGIEISGMDLSEKMLEQARTLHPEIPFRKGNILELEFENDSIAGIVAFYTIVHFMEEQVGTAFREVFRVLKPGGIFLFTYHIGDVTIHLEEFLGKQVEIDFMFFPSDFIFSSLKKSRFEKVEIIEREPYPGVEYQSRRAYVFATKPVGEKDNFSRSPERHHGGLDSSLRLCLFLTTCQTTKMSTNRPNPVNKYHSKRLNFVKIRPSLSPRK